MDLLSDELDVTPPALRLLSAYAEAVAHADRARKVAAKAAKAAEADADGSGGEGGNDDAAAEPAGPAERIVSVPRLAPGTHPGGDGEGAAPAGDAADLHGVLLAAGALDVDLSDVSAGVRYAVTRHGKSLLAAAA